MDMECGLIFADDKSDCGDISEPELGFSIVVERCRVGIGTYLHFNDVGRGILARRGLVKTKCCYEFLESKMNRRWGWVGL
jgi:hypothetical protein